MASWSARRQLTYFFGFLAVVITAGAFFASALWPQPSCSDGRRNQGEQGVDCGGVCSSVCANEATTVRALWARILNIGSGSYDISALVRNPNKDLIAHKFSYEIQFVDSNNALINSENGEISLWPGEDYPIFIPNINVGKRLPDRAYLKFTSSPRWQRATSTQPLLVVASDSFSNEPTPTVKARLTNNATKPLSKIEVGVLLSDQEHNIFAANRTFVERLGAGETKEISFIWPNPFSSLPTFTEFYTHVAIEATL